MKNNSGLALLAVLAYFQIVANLAFGQDANLSPAEPTTSQQPTSSVAIIEITSNRTIRGEMEDFDNLKVTTSFGDATFSMKEIEAIKFGLNDKGSCLFVFTNGDLVTATLNLESINVKTDWGEARIKADKIVSIRMKENGSFYADDSVTGKRRWKYSAGRFINSPTPRGNLPPRSTIFGGN